MGDAQNVINKINIKNVIFNIGKYKSLENKLIELLNKKKIKYYKCNVVKPDNIKFLNDKDFNNENDNSIVTLLKVNNYNFLLMGDASIKTENYLMNKYNISNITFLKVGHHGSNTSSGQNFINYLKPKYSIISVGKKNKFGHPKKEVLDILKMTKIYRTDLNGSIQILLNNYRYQIITYNP